MKRFIIFLLIVLLVSIFVFWAMAIDRGLMDKPVDFPDKPDSSEWPEKIFVATAPAPQHPWPIDPDSKEPITILPPAGQSVVYLPPSPPPVLHWEEGREYRDDSTGWEWRKVEGHWCPFNPCWH